MGKSNSNVEFVLHNACNTNLIWVIQAAIYFSEWDTAVCENAEYVEAHTDYVHGRTVEELGAFIDGLAITFSNGSAPSLSDIIPISAFIKHGSNFTNTPVIEYAKLTSPTAISTAASLITHGYLQTAVLTVGAMANYARLTNHPEWLMPDDKPPPTDAHGAGEAAVVAAMKLLGFDTGKVHFFDIDAMTASINPGAQLMDYIEQLRKQRSEAEKEQVEVQEEAEVRLSDMPPLVSTDDIKGEQ